MSDFKQLIQAPVRTYGSPDRFNRPMSKDLRRQTPTASDQAPHLGFNDADRKLKPTVIDRIHQATPRLADHRDRHVYILASRISRRHGVDHGRGCLDGDGPIRLCLDRTIRPARIPPGPWPSTPNQAVPMAVWAASVVRPRQVVVRLLPRMEGIFSRVTTP
jgi:hypothetical protein